MLDRSTNMSKGSCITRFLKENIVDSDCCHILSQNKIVLENYLKSNPEISPVIISFMYSIVSVLTNVIDGYNTQ